MDNDKAKNDNEHVVEDTEASESISEENKDMRSEADISNSPKKQKFSILALISFILGLAYTIFLISYFSGADNLGAGIAATLVTPHMVAVGIAVIFNGLGLFLKNKNFMLVAGILYSVGIVFFPMYFMFVIIQAVFSFIAFARMGNNSYIEEGGNDMGETKKPFYKKWWFWVIVVVVAVGALGSGGDDKNTKDNKEPTTVASEDEETNKDEKVKEEVKEETITLGDSFEFDGFNVDLGTEYSFDVVKNQFSDHDGKNTIVLPVTITNNSGETQLFNMFYFSTFDQSGNKTDSVSSYFDNSIDFSGEMRDGAVKETNFYILYSEDGDYYIEFKKPGGEKIEVKIPVVKE